MIEGGETVPKSLEDVKQDVVGIATRNMHEIGKWSEEYPGQLVLRCKKCRHGASITMEDNKPVIQINKRLSSRCTEV
jgi:hypothetical protein